MKPSACNLISHRHYVSVPAMYGLTTQWRRILAVTSTVLVSGSVEAAPRLGVGGRAGMLTHEWSPSGPWLEPALRLDVPLSAAFYAAFEAGIGLSWSSIDNTLPYRDSNIEERDRSEQRLFALPLRAAFGWNIAGPVALELGLLGGPALIFAESTQCGGRDDLAFLFGAYAGPMFRFGTRDEFGAGVHVQAAIPAQARCTNTGENPATGETPWPHWFEDDEPEPAILGQFVYSFGQ